MSALKEGTEFLQVSLQKITFSETFVGRLSFFAKHGLNNIKNNNTHCISRQVLQASDMAYTVTIRTRNFVTEVHTLMYIHP